MKRRYLLKLFLILILVFSSFVVIRISFMDGKFKVSNHTFYYTLKSINESTNSTDNSTSKYATPSNKLIFYNKYLINIGEMNLHTPLEIIFFDAYELTDYNIYITRLEKDKDREKYKNIDQLYALYLTYIDVYGEYQDPTYIKQYMGILVDDKNNIFIDNEQAIILNEYLDEIIHLINLNNKYLHNEEQGIWNVVTLDENTYRLSYKNLTNINNTVEVYFQDYSEIKLETITFSTQEDRIITLNRSEPFKFEKIDYEGKKCIITSLNYHTYDTKTNMVQKIVQQSDQLFCKNSKEHIIINYKQPRIEVIDEFAIDVHDRFN